MPIYEYRCASCDHLFDEIQKHDAEPLLDCPECKAPSLIKLISAPSFRLKGQGWYETDFKKENRRNIAGDSNASSSGEAAGASDSKSDSKSTSKGDTSKKSSTATKSPVKKVASGD